MPITLLLTAPHGRTTTHKTHMASIKSLASIIRQVAKRLGVSPLAVEVTVIKGHAA